MYGKNKTCRTEGKESEFIKNDNSVKNVFKDIVKGCESIHASHFNRAELKITTWITFI